MQTVRGKLVEGYKIASGSSKRDTRFNPEGTIRRQVPYFLERGLDFAKELGPDWFPGTLNISVAPYVPQVVQPDFEIKGLRWTDAFDKEFPGFKEDFHLVRMGLSFNSREYKGLLYVPGAGKPKHDHHQPPEVIEVIAQRMEGIKYGDVLDVLFDPSKVYMRKSSE